MTDTIQTTYELDETQATVGAQPSINNMRTFAICTLVVLLFAAYANARMFILDDGYYPDHVRTRRDTGYQAPPSYSAPKHYGAVGPVYTFVKTDPQANFKWGVRHRVGSSHH